MLVSATMPEVTQTDLDRLLELQTEDTAIARLEERRASLPEAARLGEVKANLEELGNDMAIAAKQDAEAGREQHRLEGEIELIEQQAAKEDQRLLSGSVSNPKELSALQAKVAELKKRKSTLEDELIEVMETKEGTGSTLENLRAEHESLSSEAEKLEATVAGLMSDIDAEMEQHTRRRAEVAATIPDDLLALYEKIRAQKHGVGAAALVGGTCQGCHTKLPAVELERVRSEGGLQRCDNCRRILVVQ